MADVGQQGRTFRLHEIGIAIAAFEGTHRQFPDGADEQGFSFHVSLLPFLEQVSLETKLRSNADPRGVGNPRSELLGLSLPVFGCPSDSATFTYGPTDSGLLLPAATSYHGNAGTGVLKAGYNGLFQYGGTGHGRNGTVVAGMVTDGLSNTAAASEALIGDGTGDPLRAVHNTVASISDLDVFALQCLQPEFRVHPGDNWRRGRPWTNGNLSWTMYNHVLRPNQISCMNKTSVQRGAYPPSSNHMSTVNVLFGDGHVSNMNDAIGIDIWRSLGSRDSSE